MTRIPIADDNKAVIIEVGKPGRARPVWDVLARQWSKYPIDDDAMHGADEQLNGSKQ